MPIKLIPRTAWGARKPSSGLTVIRSTRGVKIHYTGSRVDPKLAAEHKRCVSLVKAIQRRHMDGNGWNDIGYSMAVCPHGHVFVGRGPHRLPAANGSGLNHDHYAVLALVGNAGLTEPTDAMLHGLRDAIEYLRRNGDAGGEIKGHRDGYATDCPGTRLYDWVGAGAPRPGSVQPEAGPEPTPAAPAWPGRLLRYPPPTRGDDVRRWQKRMHDRGWPITADGVYGPASRATCRAFQSEHDLPVDGVVGPITWRAAWEK
jgi:murein L,D-transpeptidase YcbB/YkuD